MLSTFIAKTEAKFENLDKVERRVDKLEDRVNKLEQQIVQ
jgi:ubiquinone biosynthesis protein UbiJ